MMGMINSKRYRRQAFFSNDVRIEKIVIVLTQRQGAHVTVHKYIHEKTEKRIKRTNK